LVVTTDDYYSVTYELNGGNCYNPDEYADISEFELALPTKAGYS